MSNEIKRNYTGADAYMLESSEQLLTQFNLDITDFTQFDNHLDADFADEWLSQINQALAYKSDSTVIAEQKGKTNTVEQAMKNCQDVCNDIFYFAQKAYKTQKAELSEFGRGTKFANAAKSQAKMSEFMDQFIGVVDSHKTALLAAGCPQATIDNVTTTFNALRTFNNEQFVAINGRPAISQARVTQLNNAFAPMALVLAAAQRVYKNNATKLGQYQYNPPVNHRPSVTLKAQVLPGQIVNLRMQDATPALPADWQYDPQATVHVTATGGNLLLYSSAMPLGEPTDFTLPLKPGKKLVSTAGQLYQQLNLTPMRQSLNVQNTGTKKATIKLILYV